MICLDFFSSKKDLETEISILNLRLEIRDSTIKDLRKKLQERSFKVYNQQREISRLLKLIKELKHEKHS